MDVSKKEYLFADYDPDVRDRLQVDAVALYSVTPSWMARKICVVLVQKAGAGARITDGTACVGGDTMAFAAEFAHVVAVEVDAGRAGMLDANVEAAGFRGKVTTLCADYCNVYGSLEQDIVYLDAPWGGPDYWRADKLDLFLQHYEEKVPLVEICSRVWPRTQTVALKVPVNFDGDKFINEFTKLVRPTYDGCISFKCTDMRKALLVIVSKF